MAVRTPTRTLDIVPVASSLLGLAAIVSVVALALRADEGTTTQELAAATATDTWTYIHYTTGIAAAVLAVSGLVLLTRANPFNRGTQSILGLAAVVAGATAMAPIGILEATVAPELAANGETNLLSALATALLGIRVVAGTAFAGGTLLMTLQQATNPTLAPRGVSYLGAFGSAAAAVGVLVGHGYGVEQVRVLELGLALSLLWLAWVGIRIGNANQSEPAAMAAAN